MPTDRASRDRVGEYVRDTDRAGQGLDFGLAKVTPAAKSKAAALPTCQRLRRKDQGQEWVLHQNL